MPPKRPESRLRGARSGTIHVVREKWGGGGGDGQGRRRGMRPIISAKYAGADEPDGVLSCKIKLCRGDWTPRDAETKSRRAKAGRGALRRSWMAVNLGHGENINDKRSEIKIYKCWGHCGVAVPCIYSSAKRNRVRKGRQQKAKTGTSGVGLVSTGEAEDLDAEVAVESLAMLKQFQRGRTSASAAPTRDMLTFGGTRMTWMRI
ncbi:hypothetical protein DFH08DRAFT_817145 [Mycena albidolilacea]|uniref:Uncharacterized protein n=1 Tax=Mycena albidolilacea TaxID=1033008 RepID=A0AAD6ZJC8_9AGAR|nr:hypothetical protein DFH08DRAFT_817145 [Mycena albidolilacea]